MVSYRLIRSKRKTLTIQVTPAAEVVVKAPLRLPQAEIDRFVTQKEEWILSVQARIRREQAAKAQFDPIKRGTLPLLGKEYPISPSPQTAFDGKQFLLPALPFALCKPLLQKLYRTLAKEILTEQVAHYSAVTGLKPTAVRITAANTRWGSCSGKNSLNFSWKLIFADLRAVDYVVVHELIHIREHNHSAKFWAGVEEVLPDYKARRELLRALQAALSLQNWD